jgi:hypothetical protein
MVVRMARPVAAAMAVRRVIVSRFGPMLVRGLSGRMVMRHSDLGMMRISRGSLHPAPSGEKAGRMPVAHPQGLC